MTSDTTSSAGQAAVTGSGCGCTSAPAEVAASPAPAATTPCCGTAEKATEAGACCDPAAKSEAVAAGAGCCG